jgi:hypothetical protein
LCPYFRKICGVSLHQGVAGNAPTVVAVTAKWVNFVANWQKLPQNANFRRKTGQMAGQKGQNTQVCPYSP